MELPNDSGNCNATSVISGIVSIFSRTLPGWHPLAQALSSSSRELFPSHRFLGWIWIVLSLPPGLLSFSGSHGNYPKHTTGILSKYTWILRAWCFFYQISIATTLLYSTFASVPWVVSILMCKHQMDLIGDLCEVGCSPCIRPLITIEFLRSFYQGKCFWHLLKLKIYSASTWGGVCTTKALNN